MRIAMVGLGKLGGPVALALEHYGGHDVVGVEPSPAVAGAIQRREWPHREVGVPELLAKSAIRVVSVADAVAYADVVFVAVQTPHRPEFEGVTPLPEGRADFDYTYLRQAVGAVARAAMDAKKSIVVSVISTVLPGTMAREIVPLLNQYTRLVYNPSFIAMGTTIADLIAPEFLLLGGDDTAAVETVERVYAPVHQAPRVRVRVVEAEFVKVLYNVALGFKIALANTAGEICDHVGADADAVMGALNLATNRLLSPKYLRAGMGDSGACHPRDCIALSWLARSRHLSSDLFSELMEARERHADWLASVTATEAHRSGLPVIFLGYAYKPGTNLVDGSASRLTAALVQRRGLMTSWHDPHIDASPITREQVEGNAGVFVHATAHRDFHGYTLTSGSIVVDPWGTLPLQENVRYVRPGRVPREVR